MAGVPGNAALNATSGPVTVQSGATTISYGAATSGGSLNQPDLQGIVRSPRARLLVDNTPLPGLIEATVDSNNHYQADAFTAELSLYADPAYGPDWWGVQDSLLVTMQFALDAGWVTVFAGEIDLIDMDEGQGTVRLDGRDLSARFINARTQEAFKNKTASEVATILGVRRGLDTDVTATTTLIGRYYASDHDQLSNGELSRTTTEWDLLTYLADHEGFDVWVSGTTLHFKPLTRPDATPWVVKWSRPPGGPPISNAITLRLERHLVLAKDLIVEVRSWDSSKGKGFTKTAKATKQPGQKTGKASAATPQKIVVTRPNLTQDQAQKLANKILDQETKHERVVHWTEPSDLALTARTMMRLQGVGTGWDQTYYVERVARRFSVQGGFTMDARAKNRSVGSQVTL